MIYQYDRKDEGPRFDYRANWIAFADGRPANLCLYPKDRRSISTTRWAGPSSRYGLQRGRPARRATVCAGSWK